MDIFEGEGKYVVHNPTGGNCSQQLTCLNKHGSVVFSSVNLVVFVFLAFFSNFALCKCNLASTKKWLPIVV